jgi:FkbM family methyltransferase
MTFISYAQNFEDVMLWRAIHHVEKGFYIDVGANDPSLDSVTRVFYERGWNGINIEPLRVHFEDLQRERPRDINLRCAVGPSKGEIEIWECDVRGWASVDKVVIEKHIAMGNIGRYHQVPMTTLAEICEQHAPNEIHFLKIDVEGFERSVLEGMDFQRFRPWIVVVEATQPNSTDEVHHQWEDLLLAKNYFFVYADGLNRFYLARERAELLPAFRYPPNVFDEFVSTHTVQAEARASTAESRAWQAEATINAMQNSRSWRLTKPLRWATKKLREIRGKQS